jgi:hypothetical protein
VLFWIALLALPEYGFGVGLDDSWEQGLAHLMHDRAQAGVDYIFTFGPLGYLYTVAYEPALFWLRYAWEIIIKLAMAGVFTAVFARLPRWYLQAAFVCCALALLGPAHRSLRDTLFALFIFTGTLVLLRGKAAHWFLIPYCLLLAALSLVKFSFFVVSCVYLPLVMVHLAARRQYLACGLAPCAYGLAFLGLWLISGQDLAHVYRYLYGSLQVTLGFNAAMALPGDYPDAGTSLILAVVIIASLLGALGSFDGHDVSRLGYWTTVLLVAITLFLQWKQGFTRHDHYHAAAFFTFTLIFPFILRAFFTPRPRRFGLANSLLALAAVLSVVGLQKALVAREAIVPEAKGGLPRLAWDQVARLPKQLTSALMPGRLRRLLEEKMAEFPGDWRLPQIKQQIGDGAVDFLSQNLGVIFLNGLEWRPRPVFQSYSAYNPFLLDANAEFFRSNNAPEYVLFVLAPIDHRLPSSEDGSALLEILHHYRPVKVEKGCILLKRDKTMSEPVRATLEHEWSVHFNEVVPIGDYPGRYQTIAFEFRPTWWGRLRSLLFQPSPLVLQLTTSSGQEMVFRLVPSLVEQGILLNPLLMTNPDILRLYDGQIGTRVRSLRVISVDNDAGYQDNIRVTLKSIANLERISN